MFSAILSKITYDVLQNVLCFWILWKDTYHIRTL